MYFTSKIYEPGSIKITISATLTLDRWKEIRASIDEAKKEKGVWSPEFDFASKIDQCIAQLEGQAKLTTDE